jgi:ketosteroid isomerase-like protein
MATMQREVTAAIRANDDEFERAVRAQDARRLVEAFYADDARFMPPNQPMIEGREKIVRAFEGLFEIGLKEIRLEILSVETSREIAAEVGRYVMKIGEAEDRGKYVVAHRRRSDGSWRAFADIFNSDLPPH